MNKTTNHLLASNRRLELCQFKTRPRTRSERDWSAPTMTKDWLAVHGLRAMHVTADDLKHVLRECESLKTANLQTMISALYEFEDRIHNLLLKVNRRMQWMLQGSRRVFGVQGARRLGLLIDASDKLLCSHLSGHLRRCLIQLLKDQIAPHTEVFYVATYGSTVTPLWEKPRKITPNVLLEAQHFFGVSMQNSGASNLMAGVKTMLRVGRLYNLDQVTVVVGSLPDQEYSQLREYVGQCDDKDSPMVWSFVCFDCRDERVSDILKRLTEINSSTFYLHCYTPQSNEGIRRSNEIQLLECELSEAKCLAEVVGKFRLELERGQTDSMGEVLGVPVLPPEDVDELVLCLIQGGTFRPETSKCWLSRHGLRAKKLDFFQMLTPHAYPQTSIFVDSIGREVTGKVYADTMIQVEWPNGTTKNVYLKLPILYDYQKKLTEHITLLEKRISWLKLGSRKVFGSLVEEHVVVLVDLSADNAPVLAQIKAFLKQLLEHQISKFVRFFNIIAVGGEVEPLFKSLSKVTAQSLQEAWKWVLAKGTAGTRNVMAALRLVNDMLNSTQFPSVGLYLLTTGSPNQETAQLTEYLEHLNVKISCSLHVAFFVPDFKCENDAVEAKIAESLSTIAHSTGGRFHWFTAHCLKTSDDVDLLMAELASSLRFSDENNKLIARLQQTTRKEGISFPW
uniref:VWFA domain-containing protein n=1 Tax=Mesocestoides corti TaxID=53468 RepID=A0A5K3EXB9_MESCO